MGVPMGILCLTVHAHSELDGSRCAVAQHLKKGHPENPSAKVAAARLEKVDNFLKITPEVRHSAPPPLTDLV